MAAARGGGRAATVDSDAVPGDPEQPLGDPESVARTVCLRLLEQRARSRAELDSALTRKGVPAQAAQRVLDRFTEVGLIDDTALAQSMAGAAHRERGLARRAVAVKLRQRGLEGAAVDAALATIDTDDERARAIELVRRRMRALGDMPTQVVRRRLVALLGRKGYPPGMAYDVVRSELSRLDRDCDDLDDLAPADDLSPGTDDDSGT